MANLEKESLVFKKNSKGIWQSNIIPDHFEFATEDNCVRLAPVGISTDDVKLEDLESIRKRILLGKLLFYDSLYFFRK